MPIGSEPRRKSGVPMRLKKVEERVTRSNQTIVRAVLETEDQMELVYFMISPRAHVTWINQIVMAFAPARGSIGRTGEVDFFEVKTWVGRMVLVDLEWSTWETGQSSGAAWTVKRLHPF
jgi:hypothetical protein